MQVFVILRSAVYCHGCGGVFSTLEAAKVAAGILAEREPDDHHCYDVIPFEVDAAVQMDEDWGMMDEPNSIYTISKSGEQTI